MTVSDFRPPLRDDLAGQTPYGAPQLDIDVRLNVNENPFPPPDAVIDAVTAEVRRIMAEANR